MEYYFATLLGCCGIDNNRYNCSKNDDRWVNAW